MYDWLTHNVEAGIEQQRDTRKIVKCADQIIEARIAFPRYRLESARPVHVHDSRHAVAYTLAKAERPLHVRRLLIFLEIFAAKFAEYRRGKGAKLLTKFDESI